MAGWARVLYLAAPWAVWDIRNGLGVPGSLWCLEKPQLQCVKRLCWPDSVEAESIWGWDDGGGLSGAHRILGIPFDPCNEFMEAGGGGSFTGHYYYLCYKRFPSLEPKDGLKGASGTPEFLYKIISICAGRQFIHLIPFSMRTMTKPGLGLLVSPVH